MIEMIEANWPLFLVALLIGLAVAWIIFVGSRRTKITRESDGGSDAPAARNQALIDAPPVAAPAVPPASPMGVAGAGTVAAAAAQEAAVENAAGDDLTRIKGVGPKLVTLLNEQGITTFAQVAGWSDADIDRIDSQLGRFEGRIRRDDWVTQAKLLAADDTQGYEAQFGKL
ncbi:helix-hairpin-helix domain-containing protein [Parerythrobacter aestuarii]|uniref:helix-hairpin-helix domain-containing protein n=1 Tax=Parerythrobacter aestuarii TaxID=3020909 RepID=UPI0024DEF92A|nr:helix-hairpin-helix domain-containing protein [Parerythrobacter aestuarii]